jgi:hypothetical protein
LEGRPWGYKIRRRHIGATEDERRILVVPGLVGSLLVFAVGAILDFAITASPNQHGVNLNTVGVILMIVGVVGALGSLLFFSLASGGGTHRHRTLIDDGNGNVVRREETYQ